MKISLADLRKNYTKGGLLKKGVQVSPFKQFHLWFTQAVEAKTLE